MKPTDLEHHHPCQEQPQSGEAQASHYPGLLDVLWPPILCTPALFTHVVGHDPNCYEMHGDENGRCIMHDD